MEGRENSSRSSRSSRDGHEAKDDDAPYGGATCRLRAEREKSVDLIPRIIEERLSWLRQAANLVLANSPHKALPLVASAAQSVQASAAAVSKACAAGDLELQPRALWLWQANLLLSDVESQCVKLAAEGGNSYRVAKVMNLLSDVAMQEMRYLRQLSHDEPVDQVPLATSRLWANARC